MSDVINHPAHYETAGVECIEAMEITQGREAVKSFCLCNAYKYLWRHKHKNGKEDLDKARWYIERAKEYPVSHIIDDLEALLKKAERNL
jgi:hypothetical protein